MTNSIIKKRSELTSEELAVMNREKRRVFDSQIDWDEKIQKDYLKNLFFLVKNDEDILSFGRLKELSIIIDGKEHNILGIASIVSVVSRKGYGKKNNEFYEAVHCPFKKNCDWVLWRKE